jgi:hypothetical protein
MAITIATIIGLVAIGTAFWYPIASWTLLSLPLAWLTFTLYSVKPKSSVQTAKLSPKAKELLSKFGHYYHRPYAGKDFSSAASGIGLASLVVGVIGAFQRFWLGIVIGIVFYLFASILARQFNPEGFLVDKEERRAHNEIINHI